MRDGLRQQLDEVLDKLKFHTEKLSEYAGWRQMFLPIRKRGSVSTSRTGCSSLKEPDMAHEIGAMFWLGDVP